MQLPPLVSIDREASGVRETAAERFERALRLAQELEALISVSEGEREGREIPAPPALRFARALTRSLIDELSSLPHRS